MAFFNTSGRIANSVIGTIKPPAAYGYGLIMTNSLQGAEAGVRRQVTIEKSVLTTGGVFFDDARGADGAATTTARSGIMAYGNLVGSRVAGPVTYTYGQRGSITGSELTGPLTLTDAELGPDPSNPAVRAFSVAGSALLVSLANTGAGHRAGRGQLVGLARARRPPARSTSARRWPTAPAPLSVPARDARRRADRRDRRPVRPDRRPWGETIYPVVVAADDFGVKSVALTANGAPVATARPHAVRVHLHAGVRATSATSSRWRRRSPTPRGQTSVVSTEVKVPAITTEHARHRQRHRPGDARADASARPPRSAPSRRVSRRTTPRPRPPPSSRPPATPS